MNLNQSQEEKKHYLRFRCCQIAIAAVILIVLSGTTAVAISSIDVIRAFFSGEISRIEQDIHEPKTSVANEDFRITLEQTLSDDFTTVVIYSVEALNKKAKKSRYDDFVYMTPGDIKFEVDGKKQSVQGGMGIDLSEYNTDTKRYRSLYIQGKEQLGEDAVLETSIMGDDGMPLTIALPTANHMDSCS